MFSKKPLIKICGLTNYNDAEFALLNGAKLLGFIFTESKRKITIDIAREIIDKLRNNYSNYSFKTVGVFVNEPYNEVNRIVKECNIDFAQLHGDEDVNYTKQLNVDWYKVFRVKSLHEVKKINFEDWSCDFFLVDTYHPDVYGGTGITVDVKIALELKEKINIAGKKIILAGGINSQNILKLNNKINPDGFDISSGIEQYPGKKDKQQVEKLFDIVKKIWREYGS